MSQPFELPYLVKPGTYHISVTQGDINEGIAGDCEKCPVALALLRVFGFSIEVDSRRYSVGNVEGYAPRCVEEFIAAFDAGYTVEPFDFDLVLDWREPSE